MDKTQAVVYWIHLSEHVDPEKQGYIGVSKDFQGRLIGHHKDILNNTHKNPHLVNAVNKYGWDNLLKEVLFADEEFRCYEIESQIRPAKAIGWNIAPGGHRGPGWTKGKKRSAESIARQRKTMQPKCEEARRRKLEKLKVTLANREARRLEKEKAKLEKKRAREEKRQVAKLKLQKQLAERERRKQMHLADGSYMGPLDFSKRPMCDCGRNPCAINYIRKGKTYYRSICDGCGRMKEKLKPRIPGWIKSGYKKKTTCDLCGFPSLFSQQLTVFHIDGKLKNTAHSNLRSICLNCVEVVRRREVTWKRGDLIPDF